eukprot:COSAG01_NODE_6935_length_3432_cov_3.466247_2_plen_70_part_00
MKACRIGMSPELQIDLFVATFRRRARKQGLGLALQGVKYMQPSNLFAFPEKSTLVQNEGIVLDISLLCY